MKGPEVTRLKFVQRNFKKYKTRNLFCNYSCPRRGFRVLVTKILQKPFHHFLDNHIHSLHPRMRHHGKVDCNRVEDIFFQEKLRTLGSYTY